MFLYSQIYYSVYVNSKSDYIKTFKDYINDSLCSEELGDVAFYYILSRLAYIKPLRGGMERYLESGKKVKVMKNFHDEKEWRYVPKQSVLIENNIQNIIVNKAIMEEKDKISNELQNQEYQDIWLKFEYADIKYIIVPNPAERLELVKFINSLPNSKFGDTDVEIQKGVLISRILVLSEIKGDW